MPIHVFQTIGNASVILLAIAFVLQASSGWHSLRKRALRDLSTCGVSARRADVEHYRGPRSIRTSYAAS